MEAVPEPDGSAVVQVRRVVATLDGSPFAEHALPLAWEVARRAGARLDLVHVHSGEGDDGAEGRAWLHAAAGRLAEAQGGTGGPPITTSLLHGRPADRIHEHVQRTDSDLVVTATHGEGPLVRAWLGGVADELMRRADRPLLLVRPTTRPVDLAARPTVGRIVLPLDGSAFAEQILPPATALGRLWDARYLLVRVVHPRVADELERDHSALDEAKAYLRGVWARLPAPPDGARWWARPVLARDVAPTILRRAGRADDLVALSTRGLGGLHRLLVGSVADKVVRGARGPVLVLRPRAEVAAGA